MTTIEGQETLSPTIRAVGRRVVFWVAVVTIALAIALIGSVASNSRLDAGELDGDNPAPQGAQAVVEVLRDEGVEVTLTTTLDDTLDAIDDSGNTTLLLFDRDALLPDERVDEALSAARTLVVVDPNIVVLDELSPQVAPAGAVDGPVKAKCSLPAAVAAGTIEGEGKGYRLIDHDAESDFVFTGCFRSDEDVYSVVHGEAPDGRSITYLGTRNLVSNAAIVARGNAALALHVLGENEKLVWYIPGVGDLAGPRAPTLGELSPPWVVPVMITLLLGGIAASFWRGRRLGPLIIENLPVVVRASETMQGRSRLYQANSARLHALDSLRIGTISRLAKICGLPRAASVDDVCEAVASITKTDLHAVRHVLLDAEPKSDRALVSLSDDLLELERIVATMIKPL